MYRNELKTSFSEEFFSFIFSATTSAECLITKKGKFSVKTPTWVKLPCQDHEVVLISKQGSRPLHSGNRQQPQGRLRPYRSTTGTPFCTNLIAKIKFKVVKVDLDFTQKLKILQISSINS